eukprot:6954236-Prymnesium_polylepis.1
MAMIERNDLTLRQAAQEADQWLDRDPPDLLLLLQVVVVGVAAPPRLQKRASVAGGGGCTCGRSGAKRRGCQARRAAR